jgi:phosphomannomutase
MSTTRAIDDVAASFKADVIRTKVGEIHVAKKMKEIDAVIGGEGNGGVILPDLHLGRDAPLAIALTLQHLLESEKTLSQLWDSLPKYIMTKKKISIGKADPDHILSQLEKTHSDKNINRIDGIKIDLQDGWVHIRKSNTEPIIRVIAEAQSEKQSTNLCDSFLEEIDMAS